MVLFENGVIAGILRPEALELDPQLTAEQAMESDTRTYRLDTSLEKAARYMEKNGVDSVVLTTTDGQYRGLVLRESLAQVSTD